MIKVDTEAIDQSINIIDTSKSNVTTSSNNLSSTLGGIDSRIDTSGLSSLINEVDNISSSMENLSTNTNAVKTIYANTDETSFQEVDNSLSVVADTLGTPVSYSILHMLNPGRMGSGASFVTGLGGDIRLNSAVASSLQCAINDLLLVCPGNFDNNGGWVVQGKPAGSYHISGRAFDFKTNLGVRLNYQGGADTVLYSENNTARSISAYDVFYVTCDTPIQDLFNSRVQTTAYTKVKPETDVPDHLQKYISNGLANVLEVNDVTRSKPGDAGIHYTNLDGTYFNVTELLKDHGWEGVSSLYNWNAGDRCYQDMEWHHYQKVTNDNAANLTITYNGNPDSAVKTPAYTAPAPATQTVNLGATGNSTISNAQKGSAYSTGRESRGGWYGSTISNGSTSTVTTPTVVTPTVVKPTITTPTVDKPATTVTSQPSQTVTPTPIEKTIVKYIDRTPNKVETPVVDTPIEILEPTPVVETPIVQVPTSNEVNNYVEPIVEPPEPVIETPPVITATQTTEKKGPNGLAIGLGIAAAAGAAVAGTTVYKKYKKNNSTDDEEYEEESEE